MLFLNTTAEFTVLFFVGDNMKFKKYATKTLMIVIGSIISAYGITLAIGAGFGGATLAILWQGLTNVTGMSIGTSSLVVAVAMIIFAFFYDRKQINVGTILYQIIYSFSWMYSQKFSIIQILKRLILL